MIKAAFVHWDNRIAPVFDVARHVYLVTAKAGRSVEEVRETLDDDLPVQKVMRLAVLGVDTLVCGAISRPLYEMFSAYNIRVIPFVAGGLREVIKAWLHGGLDGETFAMPGCGGRGRRYRGMGFTSHEEQTMRTRKGAGMGMGSGQGQGSGAGRQGRMGGVKTAGPGGTCVCPQCGRREAHQRGVPCAQRTCPQCGIAMVRE
jgi:predicted Fe-Mo cluster-binding NifX family protein